jgi:hypothetical protein
VWIESADKDKQLFTVVEWLYHALQTKVLKDEEIKDRFIYLLEKLDEIDGPYTIKDAVRDALKEDAGIEYLRLKRFGEKDKLSNWFM